MNTTEKTAAKVAARKIVRVQRLLAEALLLLGDAREDMINAGYGPTVRAGSTAAMLAIVAAQRVVGEA